MSVTSEAKATRKLDAETNGLIGLSIASLFGLVIALVSGDAPLTHYVTDWINWARLSPLFAALAVFALVLTLFSAFGALHFGLKRQRRVRRDALRALSVGPAMFSNEDGLSLDRPLSTADALSVPDDREMRILQAGNVFAPSEIPTFPSVEGEEKSLIEAEAEGVVTESLQQAVPETPVAFASAEPESETIASPVSVPEAEVAAASAIEVTETEAPAAQAPAPEATNPETHAPEVSEQNADIATQDRPETDTLATEALMAFAGTAAAPDEVEQPTPVETAVIAEVAAPETGSEALPDETTATAPEAVQTISESATPPAETAETDQATEVALAVQMALSVWPDSTRGVAATEVAERIASLYINKAEAAQTAFKQIASGDLNPAANTLMDHTGELVEQGKSADAAQIWRIIGALFMGRDDGRAMNAYAKVSELDLNDGNVHLFLARRYIHSGEPSRLPAVAERALAVIGDPAIRAELLAPYAEQMLKMGDISRAAGAFEELKDYKEKESEARPEDLKARSTYGASMAQLAQAYEQLGATDMAGGLYRQAHLVFLELTERLPEHNGLKSMADNALNDAMRLNH